MNYQRLLYITLPTWTTADVWHVLLTEEERLVGRHIPSFDQRNKMNWLYYTVFSTKWTDYTIVLLVIWFINYNWLFINHPVLVIYPILVGPNHLPNHQLNVVDIPTKNQWTKNIKKHRAQPVPDDSTLAISSQLGPPAGSTKTCESRIHHVRLIGIVPPMRINP